MKNINITSYIKENCSCSLFLVIDNKNNHVLKVNHSPIPLSMIPEDMGSVCECFNLLGAEYEKFKESCIWDKDLLNISGACFLRLDISNTNNFPFANQPVLKGS